MTTTKHDCIQFVKRHEREAHDKTRQEHGKRIIRTATSPNGISRLEKID